MEGSFSEYLGIHYNWKDSDTLEMTQQGLIQKIIDATGMVVDAYVSSIELILENGERVRRDQVQYGILEAIIEATFKWEFTPAFKEGRPVKTQRTELFLFGM